MPDTILIVEDEMLTRRMLQHYLEAEGFAIAAVGTVREAIGEANRRAYDLVLLDLMLPDGHGFDVCRAIRKRHRMPIIILSTKHELSDRVTGLEAGADDYIIKPFEPREVVARVRAQLRRAREFSSDDGTASVVVGDLVVDPSIQDVIVAGTAVGLTQKEFRLMLLLAARAEKAVSRDYLVEQLWSDEDVESDKILAVYVRRVRQKIERNPDEPERLLTVRGFGYKLVSRN
ncbi:MAG TPA: response regulator transcription factor [Thermoanaerobaculia bacterium]|nr:response regulator transcription factor [Thermoanaerobaculia bacterium]